MTAGKQVVAPSASGRPPAELAFAPILNGVDFLDRAIDELLDEHDPRELKYAVLHLQAATEILLKVRLQRDGFKHVFENPEQADEAKWRRGDFRSVGLSAALTRLQETAGITLPPKERNALTRLARERNKLQHFGSTSNHQVVSNLAGKAMEVLTRFIVNHVVPEAPEDEQAPLEKAQARIGHALREIASVTAARLVHVTPELDSWPGLIIHCPNCSQLAWTFALENQTGSCRVCETEWWAEHGRDSAERYAENVLGESRYLAAQGVSEWSIRTCPECDEEALLNVATRGNPESSTTVCFQCSFTTTTELGACGHCGRTILDADTFLCTSCFADKIAED